MKRIQSYTIFILFFLGLVMAQSVFGKDLNFNSEVDRAVKVFGDPSPQISKAIGDEGRLYGYIAGYEQTVKFFINEDILTGNVKNIKLMWNDYFKNIQGDAHQDKRIAKFFVEIFAEIYAPEKQKQVLSVFFDNNDKIIETADSKIKYTYWKGPAIIERLLTLTLKNP